MLKMSLKKYKKLPIHIVENHNEVLPHIYKSIGSKYLPLNNNTLLHLDSHPDMLIPQNLITNDIYDKYELFSKLSIENWIMPAVYGGHFNKLIWVKQSFCNQIENGKYTFKIGKHKISNTIKITATNAYFLSELLYAPIEELENVKDVTLIVVTFDNDMGSDISNEQLKQQLDLTNDNFILDIDLDYFSTKNPFKDLYKNANLYDRLKNIYKCNVPSDNDMDAIKEFTEQRTKQLHDLKYFFTNIGKIDEDKFEKMFDVDVMKQLNELVAEVNKYYTIVEWELIHEAGCTCDEVDKSLPHNVTPNEELEPLIEKTFKILSNVIDEMNQPIMITISRSSEDEYCPPEQVDQIENYVIEKIRKMFLANELFLHYQDDSE